MRAAYPLSDIVRFFKLLIATDQEYEAFGSAGLQSCFSGIGQESFAEMWPSGTPQ
jgi:hypothetical protein